jgi:putative spermidine/putrescine transport system ATP-binding protein
LELELRDISVSLSGKEILKSVSFSVGDGDLISLLGVSGSGKSTLLKTIAGIIPQTGGTVSMGGTVTDSLPPHRRGAVIVFQDFRLFPHMTAAENIAFPMKMRGAPKQEYQERTSSLLERVQLAGYGKCKPREMSGGQIQRVALARALAASPNILLLDEPFSSLDENLRQDMRALVLELQREFRITTILVTHDRQEALAMSDKIAVIMHGEILQYDTPQRIFESPASREVADYFGQAIYLGGTVKAGVFVSDLVRFGVDRPDGPYQAMFRSSSVHVRSDGDRRFTVRRTSYQGESYRVVLEHENSGTILNATLPSPCPLRIDDRVSVSLDTEKAILFQGSRPE